MKRLQVEFESLILIGTKRIVGRRTCRGDGFASPSSFLLDFTKGLTNCAGKVMDDNTLPCQQGRSAGSPHSRQLVCENRFFLAT
jgi:hypothetical protein